MHHETQFLSMKKHSSTNCVSAQLSTYSSEVLNPCGDKTVIVLRHYKGKCDSGKDMVFQLISITVI